MRANEKKFIEKYSEKVSSLNVLVVSLFLKGNGITNVKGILSKYTEDDLEEVDAVPNIVTIEDVIHIFELAVPRNEKTTNGAVYTPKFIRDYIVDNSIRKFKSGSTKSIDKITCADLSCGCGAFLYTTAEYLFKFGHQNFASIVSRLYGVDISPISTERAKILLALAGALHGEYLKEDDFHVICHDTLLLKKEHFQSKAILDGVDIIVGNPPYVRSKHLSAECKESMKLWQVANIGNADLYIPFFEVGISHLSKEGILGYITVNTFFTSVNARALRHYFHENQTDLTIINFGEERIFKGKSAYTCLIFISQTKAQQVLYSRATSADIIADADIKLNGIPYSRLNDFRGWHLSSNDILESIERIENIGPHIGDKYDIKNGIATLANDIYIFKPSREDDEFFYLPEKRKEWRIEKTICKDIIKPNILKSEDEIQQKTEKLIFPYDDRNKVFEEDVIRTMFPMAYSYLRSHKKKLLSRDKGKAKDYPHWYEFGRTQAISDSGKRLLFPYMSDMPHFIYSPNSEMKIYCGYGISSDSGKELLCLKKILESKVFDFYLRNTSKPYSKGYYSYAKNYIKNFGIPELRKQQIDKLTGMSDKGEIDEYVGRLYGLSRCQLNKKAEK